jgi:hypothetical protein
MSPANMAAIRIGVSPVAAGASVLILWSSYRPQDFIFDNAKIRKPLHPA